MIFPKYLRSLGSLKNEEEGCSALNKKTKNNEVIFSLEWKIIFTYNLLVLVLVLKFLEMKYGIFEPKS